MKMKPNIWSAVNTVFLVATISFLMIHSEKSPSGAYVVNQELFAGFHGRVELNEKLEHLRLRHQRVLDSLYALAETGKGETILKTLSEKSRRFMTDEQALSDRYTQQVWGQINSYVHDYGKENKYELIFGADGSGSLMYAGEAVNITEDVLDYINERYEGE